MNPNSIRLWYPLHTFGGKYNVTIDGVVKTRGTNVILTRYRDDEDKVFVEVETETGEVTSVYVEDLISDAAFDGMEIPENFLDESQEEKDPRYLHGTWLMRGINNRYLIIVKNEWCGACNELDHAKRALDLLHSSKVFNWDKHHFRNPEIIYCEPIEKYVANDKGVVISFHDKEREAEDAYFSYALDNLF